MIHAGNVHIRIALLTIALVLIASIATACASATPAEQTAVSDLVTTISDQLPTQLPPSDRQSEPPNSNSEPVDRHPDPTRPELVERVEGSPTPTATSKTDVRDDLTPVRPPAAAPAPTLEPTRVPGHPDRENTVLVPQSTPTPTHQAPTAAVPEPTLTVTPVPPTPTSTPAPSPTPRPKPGNISRSTNFVPLDEPNYVSREQAHSNITADSYVLGVLSNGDARAYPLDMMWYHHIANDTIGGVPWLVTY